MSTGRKSARKTRLEIAHIAARYIAVDGINDFLLAKKKAAESIGIYTESYLPSNQDIETALIEYQRIYQSESHTVTLKKLRETAVSAMEFLSGFSPLLVGPVLTGTATSYTDITLHLFADEIELVAATLDNSSIPFQYTDKRIVLRLNESVQQPALQFLANGMKITLVIFLPKDKGNIPLSSIDNKPMSRASLSKLKSMLSGNDNRQHAV